MKPAEPGARRERLLDFLAAVSLANLCLLLIWRELLFADAADRYWMIDFSARHYLAALLNMAWIAAALYAGARAFRRSRSKLVRAALLVGLLVALMAPANYARLALKFDERELFQILDNWIYLVALVVAFAFLAMMALRNGRQTLVGLRLLLVLLSPFALANTAQALWATASIEGSHPPEVDHRSTAAEGRPHSRVVWLIFDELDWRLGFEERPAGVRMPEFTKLADQAVVAPAAEASSATMVAIPSLTVGRKVKSARRLDDRRVMLSFADTTDGTPWSASDNVFSEARKIGAHTEIIGFYHPYCRIFEGAYDRCAAFPMDVAHMYPSEPLGSIMLSQLARLLPVDRRISAMWMYQRIAERAAGAVANPKNDFVYAHVSVPHGPNIWSSTSQDFTLFNLRKDGYFENLELADRLLGELRRALESAGVWETTTIIATADHGWRHGDLIGEKRDRRVPLLVKFPGQHARFEVSETVDAATTVKRIVLGALRGEINGPAELQAKLAGEWRALTAASHSR